MKSIDYIKIILDNCYIIRYFTNNENCIDYINYILTLVFIKYITDTKKEKEIPFKIPDNASFDYLFKKRNNEDIGNIINNALILLEKENKKYFKDLFKNLDFNSDIIFGENKNELLKSILDNINKVIFLPSFLEKNNIDKGEIFENIIKNFYEISRIRQNRNFYTPDYISSIISSLSSFVKKKPKSVYDPACGSGSLLIHIAKKFKNIKIYGQEKDLNIYNICRMNMYFNEIYDADLKLGDTIEDPKHVYNNKLMKFDIVVSVPPLIKTEIDYEKLINDKYNRFRYVLFKNMRLEQLFVQHMLESVKKDGVLFVVLPDRFLFSELKNYDIIRKNLIEKNYIDSIVLLPNFIFIHYIMSKVILILRKNKKTNNIMYIDLREVLDDVKDIYNETDETPTYKRIRFKMILTITNSIIKKVLKLRKEYINLSYIVDLDEIKNNNYNLNPSIYINNKKLKEEKKLILEKEDIIKEIKQKEKKIKKLDKKIKKLLSEL